MTTIEAIRETLPAGTWQVDSTHSHVGFGVEYTGGTFRGSFSPVEGALEVDESGQATLSGRAKAESVKVQDENLTAHLLAPDFFDAERAPEITFSSTAIEREGDVIDAAGELTIKGITQRVELEGTVSEPIIDAAGNERIGLQLCSTVDRREFGLDWNMALSNGDPALAYDVELVAELYLVKK